MDFPCSGLSAIHEHPQSGHRPRRSSRQQTNRSTGSDFSSASIDPVGSLELTPSKKTSNSAHLDEYSGMLMKRQAHPVETEAVKCLLSMDSAVSIGSDSSSTKRKNRQKRRPRTSEATTLQASQDGLLSFHVESGSGIDPSEARSDSQATSVAGELKQRKEGAGGRESVNSDSQAHLGTTQRIAQAPSLTDAPKVSSTCCLLEHVLQSSLALAPATRQVASNSSSLSFASESRW